MATATRQTADERRVDRARSSTERVRAARLARRLDRRHRPEAGISQPYLFRLFGSKKELFLAVNDMCFPRRWTRFGPLHSGRSGHDALERDWARHTESSSKVIERCSRARCRPTRRVDDDDIRASTARGYGRLVDYVETVSGADRGQGRALLRTGMLMNVLCCHAVLDRRRAAGLLGRSLGRGMQGG